MVNRLAGQRWLLSGASRGLGRALAEALAGCGVRVVGIARDLDALRQLETRLGSAFRGLPLDLADPAAIASALAGPALAAEQFDGFIHNAGIGWYRSFLAHRAEDLRDLLQVNLGAAMQLCHGLLPSWVERGRGHLLFVGSDLARRPLANMAPYVASKHGLAGFAHSLLREFRPQGIRVGLINPGLIDTGFGGGEGGAGDGHSHLDPRALAELMVQVLQQPPGMLVDELSVHPMGQADF